MMDFITSCLSSYIITRGLTGGSILDKPRTWLMARFPSSFWTCRLCVGAWVSLAVCLDIKLWLPVWGLSYFMATQERN